jgi:hypothetical protein
VQTVFCPIVGSHTSCSAVKSFAQPQIRLMQMVVILEERTREILFGIQVRLVILFNSSIPPFFAIDI